MNETLRTLETRRSIRAFKEDQVPDEILDQILEAGTYAPTGMGRQSPVMVVVQEREMIGKLSKMNAAVMNTDSDPFYGAPTLVVVLADKTIHTGVEDGSLVMGNLMNAASSLGIGSCWVHRAREVFETEEGKKILAGWGLDPEQYIGVGNCILGYADQEGKAKPRKENYIIRV